MFDEGKIMLNELIEAKENMFKASKACDEAHDSFMEALKDTSEQISKLLDVDEPRFKRIVGSKKEE